MKKYLLRVCEFVQTYQDDESYKTKPSVNLLIYESALRRRKNNFSHDQTSLVAYLVQ